VDNGRPYYMGGDRRTYLEKDRKHSQKKHGHRDNGSKKGHGKNKHGD
jgi:hypothetical protein